MRFIDGIQRPGRIKSGLHVAGGRAWLTIGNFVSLAKPSHVGDWRSS